MRSLPPSLRDNHQPEPLTHQFRLAPQYQVCSKPQALAHIANMRKLINSNTTHTPK
jgi:hypothetical protein